jgi:hypothetical protein
MHDITKLILGSALVIGGALPLTSTGANTQTPRESFCLKQAFGATECKFQSMAGCVQSKIGNGDSCYFKGSSTYSAESSFAGPEPRAQYRSRAQ